ncbi:MAG: glycoside hydrolase family 3 C-terminal domain-containing protein [Arenibacter algicola]
MLEGIQNYVDSKANVDFSLGGEVVDEAWPESEIIPIPLSNKEQQMIDTAVAKANLSDVITAVMGEDEKRCGKSRSRTSLGLPGRQFQLLQALKATGKPIVLVLINGRPLTINWENQYIPAILEAWFPNVEGPNAIAQTLFGDYNPGGKLPITFPRSVGQLGENIKLARKRRKLTAIEVSERAGIDRKTLCQIEKGNSKVAIGSYCTWFAR